MESCARCLDSRMQAKQLFAQPSISIECQFAFREVLGQTPKEAKNFLCLEILEQAFCNDHDRTIHRYFMQPMRFGD